jgi:N-acetylglucosamine malate deacetylase 1
MKILAIGAHPDDIEIFMFGTLAAFRARGDDLVLAIATDGAFGGAGDPAELAERRREEATAAASLLGADPRFLGFPDGRLLPDRACVTALIELIGAEGVDLIISHAAHDYHGDHRALAGAVRLAAGFAAPVLACDSLGGVGPQPTHYVDITAHADLKWSAIRCHVSQEPERFVDGAKLQNRFRAGQCGHGEGSYAEAFRFEAVYPFADIRDLLPPAPQVAPVRDRGRR